MGTERMIFLFYKSNFTALLVGVVEGLLFRRGYQ